MNDLVANEIESDVDFVPTTPLMTVPLLPNKQELREKMMAYAGIIRTGTELEQLAEWLEHIR